PGSPGAGGPCGSFRPPRRRSARPSRRQGAASRGPPQGDFGIRNAPIRLTPISEGAAPRRRTCADLKGPAMPLDAFRNTFAGNPLDRASDKRVDAEWLAARLASDESLGLAVWNGQPFVEPTKEGGMQIAYLP